MRFRRNDPGPAAIVKSAEAAWSSDWTLETWAALQELALKAKERHIACHTEP